MFETLFTSPAALSRHRNGPLAEERAAYLSQLASTGLAHGTLLYHAAYCLRVARMLRHWPPEHCFTREEVEGWAAEWAIERTASGRASGPRYPQRYFRRVATGFLDSLGRLLPAPARTLVEHSGKLDEFIRAQRELQWRSEATCRTGRWQIERFLDDLHRRGVPLSAVSADDIDSYFRRMGQRWSKRSLAITVTSLRKWFEYGGQRGWMRAGLAGAVLRPRLYRHEGLPLGPTWEAVGRMLASTAGDDPRSIRDRAILLLLTVYGVRSGEARRLCLDDLDWAADRIRFERSKGGGQDAAPLHPQVGEAIARYLLQARPRTAHRTVFLGLQAPYAPLSASGLYHVVERYLPASAARCKGRGPQGLRHACARHLVEAGYSFKEVGDHLGHRSPESTRTYAKVALRSLRLVALEDLGGLA